MVAPGNNVRQEILSATAPDGSVLKLVLLHDGCYAIMRGGAVIAQNRDGASLDGMIEQLVRIAGDGKAGDRSGR